MGNVIHSLLFQPPEPSYSPEPDMIWLTTKYEERIPCFYIDKKAPLTVLFAHGNAEDLGLTLRYFEETLPDLPCNVFAFEYSGYGQSTGEPSEGNLYADVEASYLYLRDVLGIPWTKIVLFGRSLGSAAVTHLASVTPVKGVILQCPMLSVFRIAFNLRYTLPGDLLANVDRMAAIKAPVLVIHGTRDEVVPFWHGVGIYNACNDKSAEPYWVDHGDHNNLEALDRSEFLSRISKFLSILEVSEIDPKLEQQAVLICVPFPRRGVTINMRSRYERIHELIG